MLYGNCIKCGELHTDLVENGFCLACTDESENKLSHDITLNIEHIKQYLESIPEASIEAFGKDKKKAVHDFLWEQSDRWRGNIRK